jgi:DNA-binding beta-propeller fold protein YncE
MAMPGDRGSIGFDDLMFATRLHRVLVPAGRTGKVDLIDPSSREITSVDGFSRSSHGPWGHEQGTTSADEGGNFLYAIDRTEKVVAVVEGAARKIVTKAPLAGSPDYVRSVPPTGEVWVTEPDSDRIEIFSLEGSPPTPRHSAFIKVDDGPESLVIDTKNQKAFTHLWKASTLAIDLRARSIVSTWANGCKGSRGIALDEARGFVFAGCAEGKAVTLDPKQSGKQVSSVNTGNGVDVIAYSQKLRHLYIPGASSATLTILAVGDDGQLSPLATIPTADGAHCVAADDQGGVWVCDPEHGQILFLKDELASRTN